MIFPDIESYIEFMAGYRDNKGNNLGWALELNIQLASYDVRFVESVAEQTLIKGIALSIKQATLSENLIEKYKNQLKKLSVEPPNHKNYRYTLREVIHVSGLSLEDNMLFFRFPFDNERILEVKNFVNKESQGRVFWKKEKRAWVFSLTEFNVNWVVSYAHKHRIPVSPEAQELFNLIIESEKTPFKIELNINDKNEFYIENAPESLTNYIKEHIGFDDIYSLVDSSGVLGYTVNKDILSALAEEYGNAFVKLCSSKTIDLVPNKTENYNISDIIEWAIAVDRLPICVYNPNFLHDGKNDYARYFKPDEIEVINLHYTNIGQNVINIDPKIKVVYTNKILSMWEGRMPLLVTYANLLHGPSKKQFLNKAEKVVYFCETLPRK